MADVVPLKYGVIFKKAFGKVEVFREFVKDALGITIQIDKVYQEYEYKDSIGRVKIKYDLYAEDVEQRIIVEIQNSIKEGKLEGIKEGIEIALDAKFGGKSVEWMKQIKEISDIEKLAYLQKAVKQVRNVQEFEAMLVKIVRA